MFLKSKKACDLAKKICLSDIKQTCYGLNRLHACIDISEEDKKKIERLLAKCKGSLLAHGSLLMCLLL
ncbi:hypothetical protein HK407_14g18790 [Ordospora pajunii]|jgi:hypothetical protein|uniref:uncharacterized protein n=1 Tax=Ordospora pajunii TaxID=3039483 RepID=UPI0029528B6C|nr:uncharacterized protein HK407_14g18790 [Ordospora pajunii]KAH9410536.1 hypothetical protein HK407_14g18790 [Ordospora pajunii]